MKNVFIVGIFVGVVFFVWGVFFWVVLLMVNFGFVLFDVEMSVVLGCMV